MDMVQGVIEIYEDNKKQEERREEQEIQNHTSAMKNLIKRKDPLHQGHEVK